MKPPVIRCAIYTRKSSDEGLEQGFNSLDAQREAGEAYVLSQASEGWRASAVRYDDGGFSGGTMERPALRQLLADVDGGLVDVIVVYKIDRLTRSLADFARIVELLDAKGTSFVSVTQSFNTTSSMGRLTLNVLLSFAQFEREVTGERIRDKIAASKAKGMWMGGIVPLGYDLPDPGHRVLRVNQTEAETVRHIFRRYLDLGSVNALARDLETTGIRSKAQVTAKGRAIGGLPFSRGALFHLLRSPTYLGRIVHRDRSYDGQHDGIVDEALFGEVEAALDANAVRRRAKVKHAVARAPLVGRLFDADGQPMSPAFSRGSKGRTYRYYVSSSLQRGGSDRDDGVLRRMPTAALDALVDKHLRQMLPRVEQPLAHLRRVQLGRNEIIYRLAAACSEDLDRSAVAAEMVSHDRKLDAIVVRLPATFAVRGGRRTIEVGAPDEARPDAKLIAALRRAHAMIDGSSTQPMIVAAPSSSYARDLLRLAFLSPRIQADILTGRQPRHLNLETLMQSKIPLDWEDQRTALRWS